MSAGRQRRATYLYSSILGTIIARLIVAIVTGCGQRRPASGRRAAWAAGSAVAEEPPRGIDP